MHVQESLQRFAEYNHWMNTRLYDVAAQLSPEQLHAQRGAYFGSVFGTLSHIVVADTIWLKRFSTLEQHRASLREVHTLPTPTALDQQLYSALESLQKARHQLDSLIEQWIGTLDDPALDAVLTYQSMKGIPAAKRLGEVLQHFFNHQTHHRGQATTLLSQFGLDIGVTDLLVLIPNQE